MHKTFKTVTVPKISVIIKWYFYRNKHKQTWQREEQTDGEADGQADKWSLCQSAYAGDLKTTELIILCSYYSNGTTTVKPLENDVNQKCKKAFTKLKTRCYRPSRSSCPPVLASVDQQTARRDVVQCSPQPTEPVDLPVISPEVDTLPAVSRGHPQQTTG